MKKTSKVKKSHKLKISKKERSSNVNLRAVKKVQIALIDGFINI